MAARCGSCLYEGILSKHVLSSAGEKLANAAEAASETVLGQKPGEAVENVKKSASSAADTASKKTDEVKDSAGKTVEDAKNTDVSKKVRLLDRSSRLLGCPVQ